jgi:predicted metal-binding protein
MINKTLAAAFLAALFTVSSLNAQELTDVKCVVSGRAAKASAVADYRDAKVYMCCGNCVKAFEKDSSKFATMANHHLVLTGQFEQKSCPVTGKPVAEGITYSVGSVDVGFATEEAMKSVEGAADLDAKIALVYADAPFEKAFAKKAAWDLTGVKCFMMPKRDVKESKAVDHNGGKVFFCCPGCVKKWNKGSSAFETQANVQLVQTGQFTQTKCPISGGDVSEDQVSEVDGVKVSFCCENCKAKVDTAADDAAKRELVFGSKGFEKAFSKN